MAIVASAVRNAIREAARGDYKNLIETEWTALQSGRLLVDCGSITVWIMHDNDSGQFMAKIYNPGPQRGWEDEDDPDANLPSNLIIPETVIDAIANRLHERVTLACSFSHKDIMSVTT